MGDADTPDPAPDKHEPVATWGDAPLEAASISAGQCEHCGRITVRLEAESGDVFAVAHISRDQPGQLIEWLEQARRPQ